MYNYPYGDNQQINLNWIISEIIALHQRLDPDYTAPTFTQIYPFSETQQLNLDWILTELKTLKELAPTPAPTEEIDEVGQALIAGAYDADTSYQKNDYIVQDGKVYRANAATTGTFDPTKWNEVMLGNDLAIITRWADATNTFLNSLAASNVANDSSVTGTTVKDALENIISNFFSNNAAYANEIENGTDYNNLRTAGNYYCSSTANAATMTNIPYAAAHRLTVISLTPYRTAQIIVFNTSTPSIYYRYYNGSVWGSWWRTDGSDRKILYAPDTPILTANNAEIARITDAKITTETVLLSCIFDNTTNITSNVTWQSYDGYIVLTGTCTAATTAEIILSI